MRPPIVLLFSIYTLSVFGCLSAAAQKKVAPRQKIIIVMMDGFGDEYYRNSEMPTLNEMEKKGLYKVVPSLMPSVTNVNNASIITGETAGTNGITGNVFLDPATGREEYTEDPKQLLLPTIFQRAGKEGVRSVLFSCKTKTVQLLSKGAGETMCWETASPEWIGRLGKRPDIYSGRLITGWLFCAADPGGSGCSRTDHSGPYCKS
jgi:phosphonoacetate hydrolase